ncbi:type II toxin-antitoxin system HicB family antitoxin [Amycolatopsis palatopharyngis]|uniref:type II toxin-antitoxin system HicB family antitoxin n=1 Tax=Amycolatopsis palatopharyngis TaxID=187982 RepID=UPI000E2256BC|nr:type II toxin-antitoxin system HicB family antitoxin [Amycolatopsis palatopharyngis]
MSDQETVKLTVRIHPDSDGLWAEVVELPGCFATGDDLDELWQSVEENISLYLSDDDKQVSAHIENDGDVLEEPREFRLCSA